jgi:hypothetical protein
VVVSINGLHVEEDETDMFGVGAFMEKNSWALIARELFLFWRLAITPPMCVDPFTWWKIHEGQFRMLASLPNKFLGFQGFKLRLKECLA